MPISSIRRGFSLASDPAVAVRELHASIAQPDTALAVFFCSAAYDLDRLAAELRSTFAGVPIVGCTTAGEITPAGYQDGSICGFSLANGEWRAATARIGPLCDCVTSSGFMAAEEALASLAQDGAPVDETNAFGMLLIDGMSGREELVVSTIHWALGSIPLLGGSAGDDMRLKRTFVFHEGRFHANAALLTLIRTDHPFRAFRAHHFRGTERKLVVTEADPENRIVHGINAEPAAQAYAAMLGLTVADLTPEVFAERPLMVRVGPDYFVRSIQKRLEDDSLVFYSAIDVGVVLTLAEREDMVANLRGLFDDLRSEVGKPSLVIGFDCVLRGLEAQRLQLRQVTGSIMADNNVIGFSTYGEQYLAMHLNQTFTGVAIGCDAA